MLISGLLSITMTTVDRLYELYNTISDAKDNASKHEVEFEEILGGVKGEAGARRMTAQFISRYFSTFPNQEEKSLNALFDLCEDDDSAIRRQSITSLGVVCRGKSALVPKVADILAQLLQMDDPAELNCVSSALVALLRINAKGTLTGLFYQLDNNRDEIIRDRVLKFLHTKIQSLGNEVFTKEIQIFIFTEAKKFIPRATPEELATTLMLLAELSVCRTVTGQQQISDLILQQVDLTKPLLDATTATTTIAVLNQARKFFSNQVKSTPVVAFLLTNGVAHLDQLEAQALVAGQDAPALTLSLLRLLAQLFVFSENVEDVQSAMNSVFKALLEVLPVPPTEGEAGWQDGGASLQFSRVECLLFVMHQLMKQTDKDFFTDADALKDFRQRLQYFSRGSQAYQKVLREAIQGKKGDELKTEENKIKLIALKTTANINTLIKDYFHTPPAAKSTISLSWLLEENKAKDAAGGAPAAKRRVPVIFDEKLPAAKQSKTSRQIYAPPGGKFSRGASFSGGRGRGRGGRGRGFRRY